MQFKDGHYIVPLPWKNQNAVLPDNHKLAQRRYDLLEKRFMRDPELKQRYSEFMKNMMTKGYMEEVDEKTYVGSKAWYIPRHPVVNEKKPGKIRVVFDCAAKYAGVALNDLLLQGPDINNTLIGVLIKFRAERIALTADIESIFLQVIVKEQDRDSLRFYWRPVDGQPIKTFRMTRHLFGATCSPACANTTLRRTLEDHGMKYCVEARQAMKENFYVDDCLASAPDQMKAVRMIKDLSNLCLDGGFHLTKWLSNDKEVLNTVPEAERAPELKSLDLNNDDLPTGRTLGVQWSPQLDTLSFNIAAAERNYTRRGILSITSSVFDPLGLVAPFILPAKMLLQDLCRQGLGWDELIDDFSMQRWRIWLEELKRLKEWSMPRCYKSNLSSNIISIQLHVFSDASEKGYGMCAYLKQEAQDGTIQVSLVLARSRVAPLKYVSIPRMELKMCIRDRWQPDQEVEYQGSLLLDRQPDCS
ncbi:uncharacterized protein LOC117117682 [Anneissia japonica]|uniref:uncharacterized protein LOC117117682 n=1 Tax=Anneissia japonica TaxID=1529436 RepID=UPI0014259D3A|nr:uncharacterized protein LOC117117682 [Anneissia japonica]